MKAEKAWVRPAGEPIDRLGATFAPWDQLLIAFVLSTVRRFRFDSRKPGSFGGRLTGVDVATVGGERDGPRFGCASGRSWSALQTRGVAAVDQHLGHRPGAREFRLGPLGLYMLSSPGPTTGPACRPGDVQVQWWGLRRLHGGAGQLLPGPPGAVARSEWPRSGVLMR